MGLVDTLITVAIFGSTLAFYRTLIEPNLSNALLLGHEPLMHEHAILYMTVALTSVTFSWLILRAKRGHQYDG